MFFTSMGIVFYCFRLLCFFCALLFQQINKKCSWACLLKSFERSSAPSEFTDFRHVFYDCESFCLRKTVQILINIFVPFANISRLYTNRSLDNFTSREYDLYIGNTVLPLRVHDVYRKDILLDRIAFTFL